MSRDDETCWNEVWSDTGNDVFEWTTCNISECHPGDLLRVNSSDGPGEPFIYVEPPPMFDNLGAMGEPELDSSEYEAEREDGKRALSLRLTAFSPHRHGRPACPWCGEPFGPDWLVTERVAPTTFGIERRKIVEHWFEVTCPRCSWMGVFGRETH